MDLNTLVQTFYERQYWSAAGLVLISWDTLLTLDEEVKYVWQGNQKLSTLVNSLFLLNRWWTPLTYSIRIYFFFTFSPQRERCIQIFRYLIVAAILGGFIMGASLCIRAWALYNRSRRAATGLAMCLSAATAWATYEFTRGNEPTIQFFAHSPVPGVLRGCIPLTDPTFILWGVFLGPVLLNFVVAGMTFYKVFLFRRMDTQSTILEHIARSGILYCFAVIASSILGILSGISPSITNLTLAAFPEAIWTVSTSRLLLSMRREIDRHRPAGNEMSTAGKRPDEIELRGKSTWNTVETSGW